MNVVKKLLRDKTVEIIVEDLLKFRPLLHDEDNENCWCNPEVMQPCPENDAPGEDCASGCFRCSGRNLVVEYEPEDPAIIIHRDV